MLAIGRALLTNPTLLIMDEPSGGPRAGDHRAPDRDVQEARAGGPRDPADRAEPRHGDGDRRAPARDGRGRRSPPRRRRSELTQRRGAAAPLPRRRAARGARVDGDRRPARNARHEGRRVRVPARPAARARRRRARGRRRRPRAGRTRARHRARRGRRAAARTSPSSPRGDRGAAVDGDGGRRRGGRDRGCTPRAGSTAILALGGSGGSSIATRAMRALPVGVPKLMVSTVASGDTRPYVGAVDVTMMYSVVDISGVNRVSARIMANAAGAIAGMVGGERAAARRRSRSSPRPMFGVTTPCVTRARERLEELGYEVLVFHATGAGGQSMEALARGGFLAGVLDVTTTELADELVGGVLSAGPGPARGGGRGGRPAGRLARRARHGQLRAARDGAAAVRGAQPLRPQPDGDADADDARRVRASSGAPIGRKLSAATGPTALFVPLGGVSMIARRGPAVPRRRRRRGAARRAARDARPVGRGARARRGDQRSRLRDRRWPTGCTS